MPVGPAIAAGLETPETIIVTGRGLGASKGDVGYDVVKIDRKRIAESASGRLEDVLRDVAGLQSFRRSDARSSHATNQSITLRGLGGNAASRALLVLDGVPQADPFGGWITFPAYSTERLAGVRITRGGGSGLWGPGALVGTVELESAGPETLRSVEGELAYGSRNSLDARASVLLGDARNFLSIAGAFARGDGFIPVIERDRGPIDRRSPFRQSSAALRGVVSLTPSIELQANLSAFRDERERGTPNTDNRGKGVDFSARLVGRGATAWSLLAYGQKREFASQFASIDAQRTTSTLALDQYQVPSTGWGGRAEIDTTLGDVSLRFGGDLRAVRGETDELYLFVAGTPTHLREAGGRSLTAGAFADATRVNGPLTVNLSGRLDHWSIHDGKLFEQALAGAILTDTAFGSREGWELTGRGAIAYRLSRPVSLRAAAYRGWRLPTLNELYRPFRVGADVTGANAGLRPETSLGGEIGVDLEFGRRWTGSATLFATRLDDAIANVTIGSNGSGSLRRRENLDRIVARGIELSLAGEFGRFDAAFSYSCAGAMVHTSGIAKPLDGLRPAQTPRHMGSATLGWDGPSGSRIVLILRGVSSQFEDDLNLRRLKGAITIDGSVSVPLLNNLAIQFRGENVLDQTVEAGISGREATERALPRTLWMGIRIR